MLLNDATYILALTNFFKHRAEKQVTKKSVFLGIGHAH